MPPIDAYGRDGMQGLMRIGNLSRQDKALVGGMSEDGVSHTPFFRPAMARLRQHLVTEPLQGHERALAFRFRERGDELQGGQLEVDGLHETFRLPEPRVAWVVRHRGREADHQLATAGVEVAGIGVATNPSGTPVADGHLGCVIHHWQMPQSLQRGG